MDYKNYDYNTNEQTIKTKQKYSVSRKSMVAFRRTRERSRRKKRYKRKCGKNSKNIHKQQQQKQISSPTMLIREGRDRGGKDEKMYKEIYHFFPLTFYLNFKIN